MNYEEQVRLASRLLRLDYNEALAYSRLIPESNFVYLSPPTRGGISLIVGDDGSVLHATSATGFSKHYDAFKRGDRTPLSYFE